MKKLAKELVEIFQRLLIEHGVPAPRHPDYFKWLRFYLDFCAKHGHLPRRRESLPEFMKKLQEKGQSVDRQAEAAQAVEIYYGRFGAGSGNRDITGEPPLVPVSPWQEILNALHREIKVRGYSRKTFATYAHWISDFQGFVKEKAPETCETQDVKDYLSYLAVDRHVAATTQN